METLRLGPSLDKVVDMGCVVDQSQKKAIAEYVEEARQEGAEVGAEFCMLYIFSLQFIFLSNASSC